MKNPAFVLYTDVHLKKENQEAVLISIRHMIKYCLENNIKEVVFGGDLFHSRSNQSEDLLQTADKILNLINDAGLKNTAISGNHDKQSYFSYTSFLDIYRYHPNLTLITRPTKKNIAGIDVTFIPFFDDSILVPMLEEAEGGDMLISHFEMKGSSHLGKVSEKSSITRKTLKKWSKTYLGHYHNTNEITPNIVHLPSLRQNDFGEDSNKGFSVIYDDLSYEIIRGEFKAFTKITLDIDVLTSKEIKELIKTHENSSDTIRFELVGDESKVKALDKTQFKDTGIDIKAKYSKPKPSENTDPPKLIKKFDKGSVIRSFEEFCKEKEFDLPTGLIYLNKFLNKKNG